MTDDDAIETGHRILSFGPTWGCLGFKVYVMPKRSMYAIYAYIGVVPGGSYIIPYMECLGCRFLINNPFTFSS